MESDADLAAQIHANFIATSRLLRTIPGVRYHEALEYISCRTPCRTEWLNGVVQTNLEGEDLEAGVSQLIEEFQRDRIPSLWHIGELSTQREELETLLLQKGLEPLYAKPAMILPLDGMNFTRTSGLRLDHIQTQQHVTDWYDVFCENFGICAEDRFFLENANKSMVVTEKDPHQALVGYYGNQPVCVGSVFFSGELAAIYNLSTLPEFREKGFGRDMTLACLEVAKNLGYKVVGLSSTEAGLGLYRGLGFREIGEIKVFRIF